MRNKSRTNYSFLKFAQLLCETWRDDRRVTDRVKRLVRFLDGVNILNYCNIWCAIRVLGLMSGERTSIELR